MLKDVTLLKLRRLAPHFHIEVGNLFGKGDLQKELQIKQKKITRQIPKTFHNKKRVNIGTIKFQIFHVFVSL